MGSSNIDDWCEYAMLLSAPSGHSLTRFLKPKCTRLFTRESTKVKSDPTGAQFRSVEARSIGNQILIKPCLEGKAGKVYA